MPCLVSEHSKIHQAEQLPWEGCVVVCPEPVSEGVSESRVGTQQGFDTLLLSGGMWQLCGNVTLTAFLWSPVLQVLMVCVHVVQFPWILMRRADMAASFLHHPGQIFL